MWYSGFATTPKIIFLGGMSGDVIGASNNFIFNYFLRSYKVGEAI
jgi:hypothetical protein